MGGLVGLPEMIGKGGGMVGVDLLPKFNRNWEMCDWMPFY